MTQMILPIPALTVMAFLVTSLLGLLTYLWTSERKRRDRVDEKISEQLEKILDSNENIKVRIETISVMVQNTSAEVTENKISLKDLERRQNKTESSVSELLEFKRNQTK